LALGSLLVQGTSATMDLDDVTISGGAIGARLSGAEIVISGGTSQLIGASIGSGSAVIRGGATLAISGLFANNGKIEVDGTLMIGTAGFVSSGSTSGVALLGTGTVSMGGGVIDDTGVATTLTTRNTISGAGAIGDGSMTLINSATINANVSGGTLYLDATSTTNTGKGILQATSSGTLVISGTVANSGTVIASGAGSFVDIASTGVVSGGAVKVGNGIVDVQSGGSANIAFVATGSGGLEIADSAGAASAFTGTVSGFGGANHSNHKQFIDLVGVPYAAGVVSETYAGGATSGVLSISSGAAVVATISMVGSYTSGNFVLGSGSGGVVQITDPSAIPQGGTVQSANATLFGSYIAGSFVTAAGGQGGAIAAPTSDSQPPLLTHPTHA